MDNLQPIQTRKKRDWWQKGRALDLWSIPHFLFGMLMAFLPTYIDISFSMTLVLTTVLAVLWELFETSIGIKETVLNSLLDIFLPISAFIISSYFLRFYTFHSDELLVAFIAIGVLYVFTNISGWLAYRRRDF